MRISEIIADMINQMLNESDGTTEIQRNEFASRVGCVPSQINYVLSSRFTAENGYIVESRRGGGGYIRITKISLPPQSMIMHIVNSIGYEIDFLSSNSIIQNLANEQAVTLECAKMLLAATNDNTLKDVPLPLKDKVRASLLKNLLINTIRG